MELHPYQRRVNYYETDQMSIVHHSNYIRWFEEARLDLLDQAGLNYRKMEATGIIVPVVDVSCRTMCRSAMTTWWTSTPSWWSTTASR